MKGLFSKKIVLALALTVLVGGSFLVPGVIEAQTSTIPVVGSIGLGTGGIESGGAGAGSKILDDVGGWAIEEAAIWIVTQIMTIASWLTGLAAVLLNGILYYTVVNISENYTRITAIQEGWGVFRDLANMGFIFILLYAAIMTILGLGDDNKKLIVKVIIIAVLINFSLFFTRLVIDSSNVLALFFYDAMAPEALNATGSWNGAQWGLSNAFMEPLKLQRLYDTGALTALQPGQLITLGIMGTVLLLIASFVFLAVSLLFIIRYVVLVLVLILSPVAFATFVLPKLKKYGDQWWEALVGQSFFAPIYFVLTYVSLRILTGMLASIEETLAPGNELAEVSSSYPALASFGQGALNTFNGSFAIFINFTIVIVFLIAALIISRQWADRAGGGINKVTKWATGFAGGATFGMAARAGRYTLGAGAEMAKKTRAYGVLESTSAKGGVAGFASKMALKRIDKTSSASFDFRGSRAGSAILGEVGAGQAKQGGFEADRKAYREYMEKPGTEAYKKRQERGRRAETELDITKRDHLAAIGTIDSLNNEERDINDAIANAGGIATAAQTARLATIAAQKTSIQPMVDKFEQAISKATTKEIEAIVDSNRHLLQSQEFANRLSVQQLEAINKSDKFSEQDKETLKKNRFSFVKDLDYAPGLAALAIPAATRTPTQIIDANRVTRARTKTKALADSEVEMMDPEWVNNDEFIGNMRQPQVDAALKNSKTTQSQKDKIRKTRRQPLIDALNAGRIVDVEKIIKKTDPKVLAGYMNITGRGGINIARDPAVIAAYSPQLLKKMAAEMTQDDIDTLRSDILRTLATPPGATPHPTVDWLNDPRGGMIDFK